MQTRPSVCASTGGFASSAGDREGASSLFRIKARFCNSSLLRISLLQKRGLLCFAVVVNLVDLSLGANRPKAVSK